MYMEKAISIGQLNNSYSFISEIPDFYTFYGSKSSMYTETYFNNSQKKECGLRIFKSLNDR